MPESTENFKIVTEILDIFNKKKIPSHEAHTILVLVMIQLMLQKLNTKDLETVMDVANAMKSSMIDFFVSIGWE